MARASFMQGKPYAGQLGRDSRFWLEDEWAEDDLGQAPLPAPGPAPLGAGKTRVAAAQASATAGGPSYRNVRKRQRHLHQRSGRGWLPDGVGWEQQDLGDTDEGAYEWGAGGERHVFGRGLIGRGGWSGRSETVNDRQCPSVQVSCANECNDSSNSVSKAQFSVQDQQQFSVQVK
eukprot:scaffold220300_cov16-Tisochrysis_lutea.AAC.1